mgnify:CR=1 FL=1
MAKASIKLAEMGVGKQKILNSCPSCLQGVCRLEGESGVEADYIVVELARQLKGEDWQRDFVKEVKNGYECGLNIEKFNDMKVGDHVEAYHEVEVAKTL